MPLSERHASFVREGDWCRGPWNFERAIHRGLAPCYLLVGDEPKDAWVTFAAMPSRAEGNPDRPFLSAMKYGKGVIILVGESLRISHFRIIDNIRREFGLDK